MPEKKFNSKNCPLGTNSHSYVLIIKLIKLPFTKLRKFVDRFRRCVKSVKNKNSWCKT